MTKRLLIFINLTLVLILLSEVALITQEFTKDKSTGTTSLQIKPTTQPFITPTASPINNPLMEGFEWKEVDPTETGSLQTDFATSFPIYASPGPNNLSLQLTGKEWKYENENLTPEERTTQKKALEDYALNYFTSNGWGGNLEIEGVRFSTVAADGPIGSMRGFLKRDGDNIRLAILSWLYILPGQKVSYEYPTALSFRIFISDPIPVSTLLNAAKESRE